jgi:hypothetical protein
VETVGLVLLAGKANAHFPLVDYRVIAAEPGESKNHRALKVSYIQHGLLCVVANSKVRYYIARDHGYTAAISKVKLPWC